MDKRKCNILIVFVAVMIILGIIYFVFLAQEINLWSDVFEPAINGAKNLINASDELNPYYTQKSDSIFF